MYKENKANGLNGSALARRVNVCLDGKESETHLAAERHLEDVPVTASTEQEVLAGVKGHGHDLHIKQDGQQQLAGGQLPHLVGRKGQTGTAW